MLGAYYVITYRTCIFETEKKQHIQYKCICCSVSNKRLTKRGRHVIIKITQTLDRAYSGLNRAYSVSIADDNLRLPLLFSNVKIYCPPEPSKGGSFITFNNHNIIDYIAAKNNQNK